MAGTITFGGIGSGMDVEGLIDGLTQVSRAPLSSVKSRAASYRAAVSTLSDIGSLLSKFKSAVSALDTAQEVGSYSASSSGSAVAVSANGLALPGAYEISVSQLAKEQRTYSNAQSSQSGELGMAGTLNLSVGSDDPTAITVEATDSLNSLADKINSSGLRVSASVFYDGTDYRLQVRGLDTGAANALTFDQQGFDLGLQDAGNTKQAAQDAVATIDTFTVTSSTNQITGAIPGVTLALKEKTTSPVTVQVTSDPSALGDKLQAVVDSYNAVIDKIHKTAGHGSLTASNPALAADSALRGITSQLSSTLVQTVGSGTYQTVASLGVQLDNTGKLTLDRTKLSEALDADPNAVSKILAGNDDTEGIMDLMNSLAGNMTSSSGSLQSRKDGLESRAKGLEDRVSREEVRIDRYAEMLRKQFTAMDSTVAAHNNDLNYLLSVIG